MNFRHLLGGATAISAALAIAPPAIAQQTTSDIRGQIVDETGTALEGATVTIIDTRTNQARTSTTNEDGFYNARNLSTGGPYSVSVTAANRQTQRAENVFVSVSGSTSLDFQLSAVAEDARTLDAVVVTGSASGTLAPLAIGPGTSFGIQELSTLPSINRDLRDTIRLDPRVVIDETNDDNISCLGGNNRGNSFTVDGVRSNDGFGLNASGFPSRNSTPIPFDSIQEVSVEFSPFDVEYGQFTGCNINVVTISGENEFHGSSFFVYSGDQFFGDTLDGSNLGFQDFENLNWGASLSGPIIKDRLFFAVTYEQFKDTDFINQGPAELGFLNQTDSTLDEINQVQSILENQFGFETGGIVQNVSEESTRVLARLDWLITDRHRAEFSYNYLDEAFEETDDLGFTDFTFRSNFELSGSRADIYSARLFSEWTDNLSTEVRVSRNDVTDRQDPLGGGEAQDDVPVPRFLVNTASGGEILNGPGFFRSANALETTLDQIKLKADYQYENHALTVGYEYDSLDVFNLFAPNAVGTFEFDSIADLAAGQASNIEATGSFSGDINDAAAEFSRNIHSIYAQDEWQITPDLTLLLGLRYDWYQSDDNPTISPAFVSRYGFDNTTAFNDLDAFLPRFGVTYESPLNVFGQTTFTGGVGIFAGGDPTVFFSNAFTNFGSGLGDGAVLDDGAFQGACSAADLVVGANAAIPACVIAQQQAAAAVGAGRIDAIDPNLQLPTTTRFSLGMSHLTDFGGAAGGFFDDWTVKVDYIHTIPENTFDFIDLTLTEIGTAPDGRPTFNAVDPLLPGCDATFLGPRQGFSGPAAQLAQGGACDAGGDDQDILLTNAVGGDGNSDTASFQLAKRFDYELGNIGPGAISLNFGYAWTDVTNVNPNTSSTATSNFEEVAVATFNNSRVAPSGLFNEHNVTLSARFEQDFIQDLTTAITLRYNGRSGRRFSFVFDDGGNDFGDTDNEDRNLLFIPELGDPRVIFDAPATEAMFNQFIAEQGLEGSRGSILTRNAFEDPFFNDLDIRFEQELPTFLNGVLPDARALAFVDVNNFLNLIDDGANNFRQFDRGDVNEGVPVIDVTDNGDGTFTFENFDDDLLEANGGGLETFINPSVWQVQFGIRFEF